MSSASMPWRNADGSTSTKESYYETPAARAVSDSGSASAGRFLVVSESDGFAEQQDDAAPGLEFRVEDEQAVDGTGLSVGLHGAVAFQREAVVFDAAQRSAQVGHHLLRPDDPDRAEGAAGVPGKLASAGRGDQKGAGFGDRVDAAQDDVGGGYQ